MGLEIKSKEENGIKLYKLVDTISDLQLHKEEWIDENAVKKILINRKLWRFIDEIQEIDMCFPYGYRVDEIMVPRNEGPDFYEEYLKHQYALNDGGEQQFIDFVKVLEKHEITLYDTNKLGKIIADIRNKLSPLVNLSQMVKSNIGTEMFMDDKFLEILSSCGDTGVDSSEKIVAKLNELEKMC